MKPPAPALLALVLLLGVFMTTAHAESAPVLGSTVFNWEELAMRKTDIGERRDVARNPTPTLAEFECHVTTLNAGLPSHPPHVHPQEELIVLNEGTLEVYINGTTHTIGPGSLFFFASYDAHAVRNVGKEPARYHVFNFLTPKTRAIGREPAVTAHPDKLRSGVFEWNNLPVERTAVGHRREVLDAPTVTTERLRAHVTSLNPGMASHAPHRHPEEEIILVKEGTVEVTINGAAQRVGPGSVLFFASNDEHGLKNAGAVTATYYVIRVHTEATPPAANL